MKRSDVFKYYAFSGAGSVQTVAQVKRGAGVFRFLAPGGIVDITVFDDILTPGNAPALNPQPVGNRIFAHMIGGLPIGAVEVTFTTGLAILAVGSNGLDQWSVLVSYR